MSSPPASSPRIDGRFHDVGAPDLTATQLHDLLKLRVDVFVVEQDCPYHEIDGRDLLPDTRHLWLDDEAGITAAIRVLGEPGGYRIGRVVTRFDVRGSGLSSQLMERAHASLDPDASIVLDAQSHLLAFYRRHGYEVTGPEYLEDGIPHLPMIRTAGSSSGPS